MPRARALSPVIVSLLAAASLPPAGAGVPALVSTITSTSSGAASAFAAFDATTMKLADFMGDGRLEVVAQNDNGKVYVFDPVSGRALATLSPGNAGCTSPCYTYEGVTGPINSPAVGDLDGSGTLSVVVASTAAVVDRFVFDLANSTSTGFVFHKAWERRFNDYQSFTTMDASPVLADLLGDGRKETIVSVEQVGIFAVFPNGTLLWKIALTGGHATPAVGDLDGDGRPEIVIANDAGAVFALAGATGALEWKADVSGYVRPGSIPAAPLIADILGDARAEIVVAGRDAHDALNFSNDHFMMLAFDAAGRLLWRAQPAWGAPLTHTRLIAVNVNGTRAILGGDWNTIGHEPGNWTRVGPGHVFLFSANGTEVWHRDLDVAFSDEDLAVADLVGDGTQQVIVECSSDSTPGVCAFDLASGATKLFLATTPWEVTRSIVVGDLFHDGRFAMVVPVNASATGALLVYHGANALSAEFPGWDALAPPHGAPGPSPPVLYATFVPSGNNWWVQAMVTSAKPIVAVDANVNGGAWIPLTHYSWGGWAKSVYVATWSLVSFRATASDGSQTTSASTMWPPGTTIPSTFSATFKPCCANAWWVQVSVTPNAPLAGVDVSVNNGTWIALTNYGWGWAKSVHVLPGSSIVFRARSTTGATATSASYPWPS